MKSPILYYSELEKFRKTKTEGAIHSVGIELAKEWRIQANKRVKMQTFAYIGKDFPSDLPWYSWHVSYRIMPKIEIRLSKK